MIVAPLEEFREKMKMLGLDIPLGGANSASHAKEWAAFTRAACGRKSWVKDISPFYVDDKHDLFNVWLSNNKDMTKCKVVLERRNIKRETFGQGWNFVKKRELLEMYAHDSDKVELAPF
jgi:hypothetical protein